MSEPKPVGFPFRWVLLGFVLGTMATLLFIYGFPKNFLAVNTMLAILLVIALIAIHLRKPSQLGF